LLFNQARNLYSNTTFNISAAENSGTVLQFGPLTGNALFLTLHIQCKNSNEFARFDFRLTAPAIHETPVFINRPHNVLGCEGLLVRHAVFDSGSSTIHFSYEPDLLREGLRLNPDFDEPFVSLYAFGNTVTPLTNENAKVYFEEFNLLMGVATFGPVLNLEGNVDVIFHGLTYYYPFPEVHVVPEQLFGRDQDDPLPVETGPFTLFLEGMEQQGTYVVLAMHGLNENNRRAVTNLDITLRVTLDDGSLIDMPGIVRAAPLDALNVGTDVLFNMAPYGNRLREIHISNYSLVINWVEYDVPSVSVPIHVTRFHNMKHTRRHAAELAINEAFRGLLAHKSGEVLPENIVGLSDALRNSNELFNDIFAAEEFDGRAVYVSSVSTGDLVSNYEYLAIVEVLWTVGEGADLQYFRKEFQVTARSTDMIWAVVEIIRL
jgi:hypothetical protein